MLFGRGLAVHKGMLFVGGCDVDSLYKYVKTSSGSPESQVDLTQLSNALVKLNASTLESIGGFSIALKPKQVLLTPPGMILIESPLGENCIFSHWQYLVPSHLVPEKMLSNKIDLMASVVKSAMAGLDDNEERPTLAKVREFQKLCDQFKLSTGLLKWASEASCDWPLVVDCVRPDQCLDHLAAEVRNDKRGPLSKAVRKFAKAFTKLATGGSGKNADDEKDQIIETKVVDFKSTFASLSKQPSDIQKKVAWIVDPAIMDMRIAGSNAASSAEQLKVRIHDASLLLDAFQALCKGDPSSKAAAAATAATRESDSHEHQVTSTSTAAGPGVETSTTSLSKAATAFDYEKLVDVNLDFQEFFVSFFTSEGIDLDFELRRARSNKYFAEYEKMVKEDVEDDWEFGDENGDPAADFEHWVYSFRNAILDRSRTSEKPAEEWVKDSWMATIPKDALHPDPAHPDTGSAIFFWPLKMAC